MRKDLDHLPQKKQRELAHAVEILFAEFEDVLKLATSPRKKSGRILKVILFGSYARGGWVDEPHTSKGYMSDYDLLVIVNHKDLTDLATYWHTADDRLMRDPEIKTPVNFIVHTMDEVNNALAQGQYFFSDIKREGIVLYELPGYPLVEPKAVTAEEAYNTAKKHYEFWCSSSTGFMKGSRYYASDADYNKAAFLLHQALENLYTAVLLVLTNYSPPTHNIKFLRSLAESKDARLIDAWPRETKHDRRIFELLKRAYVEARYSEHYAISSTELKWLDTRIEILQKTVHAVYEERLHELQDSL